MVMEWNHFDCTASYIGVRACMHVWMCVCYDLEGGKQYLFLVRFFLAILNRVCTSQCRNFVSFRVSSTIQCQMETIFSLLYLCVCLLDLRFHFFQYLHFCFAFEDINRLMLQSYKFRIYILLKLL